MRGISKKYDRPLAISTVVQLICAFVASLVLDGGQCLRIVVVAIVAYWVGLLLMVMRRPQTPTRNDLHLATAGFLILVLAVALILVAVERFLGQGL